MKKFLSLLFVVLITLASLCLYGCEKKPVPQQSVVKNQALVDVIPKQYIDNPASIGKPYIMINGGIPVFEEKMFGLREAEVYSELDKLGRCGPAYAVITRNTMPTEKRGKIGMIKPSGWHTVRYDDLIKDKYLYNRCHLIGFQLAGENDNNKNLITGTRYLNVDGMLPFENMVTKYVKDTGKPVLYRVVPIFKGNDLVARGVTMEGYSLNDKGKDICFFVFVPNIQPGVVINYADGTSKRVK